MKPMALGHYLMNLAVIPSMQKNHFGRVVNVTSVLGVTAVFETPAYSASKAAAICQTKAFAKKYGKDNITFNSLAPGMIDTPMKIDATPEEYIICVEKTPLGRIAQPIDIARSALFFAQGEPVCLGSKFDHRRRRNRLIITGGKVMRCKVALVPRMGEDIIVEEVELAEPRDYEVRIKVMTCTICHTDIHGFKGEHGAFEGPGTGGHEIAGIVDKIGSKVTYVKPGDRVLSSLVRQGCGTCDQCLHGRHWFCENLPPMSFRTPSPYTRDNGRGSVRRRNLAPAASPSTPTPHEAQLCKLDDDIPFVIGSVMACGFISGFGAVLNRCKVKPGQSIAVVGCGGVGLSAIMGAEVSGAIPIVAIDTMDVKLEAAKKFGATHFINPKKSDVVEEIRKITRGFGVDHSVVATAGDGIKRSTFDLTADYGRMVVVGHARREDEMMSDMCYMDLLQRQICHRQCYGGRHTPA